MQEISEYLSGVHLHPNGFCEPLYISDELQELEQIVSTMERQSKEELRSHQTVLAGTLEKLLRELTQTGLETITAHVDALSMQMMAAVTEFKQESSATVASFLGRELVDEKRGCSTALLSKIECTLQSLSWSKSILLAVNPAQVDQVKRKLSPNSQVEVVPAAELELGNFRLGVGKTSITYDLTKDIRKLSDELRDRLLLRSGD